MLGNDCWCIATIDIRSHRQICSEKDVELRIPEGAVASRKGVTKMPKKKARKRTSHGKRRTKQAAAHVKKLETALTAVKKHLAMLADDPHHFV